MDGENNRRPYEQMDDLEVPLFLETIYIPGTCECPLFWGLNPLKEGRFQSKQGSFGFQIYIYIYNYIYIYLYIFSYLFIYLCIYFKQGANLSLWVGFCQSYS